MRRLLAPLPATYSLAQLRQAAAARFSALIDFNTVDVNGSPNAAVYLPDGDATDPAAWQASVAAHTPTHPTPEERAAGEAGNEVTVRDQASAALATNATFLGIASPTNAQTAAQVKALTRQVDGLIRLAVGRFDGTD
jgi:hypothetical protein